MVLLTDLLYGLLWLLFLPVVIWQNLSGSKKRSDWSARLLGKLPAQLELPSDDDHVIWLHGVSVGEINLIGTLLPSLQNQYPASKIYISSSTDSGLDLALKKFPQEFVFRCPWDFSWSIKSIFKKLRPSAVVLAELEIWPNWIRIAQKRSVPVIVINGRLSESSHRGYRKLSFLTKPIFRSIALACCQSKEYADRFVDLGTPSENVRITGSMKFDAVKVGEGLSTKARSFRDLVNLSDGNLSDAGTNDGEFVFLAGSTSDPEEEIVLDSFLRFTTHAPNARLILVPRHPERFDQVAKICESKTDEFLRRSEIQKPLDRKVRWKVLLVDTVGELRDWWALADVGFVGGSMGKRGGQSMIEPASYGIPCSFGPNTKNFKDVVEMLLADDAAKVVRDSDQLSEFLRQLYSNPEERIRMGEAAKSLARNQQGATQKTILEIRNLLGCGKESSQTIR